MSPEEIGRLMSGEAKAAPGGMSGIGVSNVDARLKLMYGEAYGVSYRSEKNRYTEASVRIPKEVAANVQGAAGG